jgi:hypothetical protein
MQVPVDGVASVLLALPLLAVSSRTAGLFRYYLCHRDGGIDIRAHMIACK